MFTQAQIAWMPPEHPISLHNFDEITKPSDAVAVRIFNRFLGSLEHQALVFQTKPRRVWAVFETAQSSVDQANNLFRGQRLGMLNGEPPALLFN
jgi:hypothetical protein